LLAGVSRAPHELGLAVRILAPDGGALARGLDIAFTARSRHCSDFRPRDGRK